MTTPRPDEPWPPEMEAAFTAYVTKLREGLSAGIARSQNIPPERIWRDRNHFVAAHDQTMGRAASMLMGLEKMAHIEGERRWRAKHDG